MKCVHGGRSFPRGKGPATARRRGQGQEARTLGTSSKAAAASKASQTPGVIRQRVITNTASLTAMIMSTSRNGGFILIMNQRKSDMMAANRSYWVMRP